MEQKLEQKNSTFIQESNTKVANTPPSKGRNWCFTLNNHITKDIDTILRLKLITECKQFCFQEEKGKNGTPHLQGVIAWKNAVSFNTVRKLLPRAHWEKAYNLKKALAYCCKADTRYGMICTHNYTIFNDGRPLTRADTLAWIKRCHLDHAIQYEGISF